MSKIIKTFLINSILPASLLIAGKLLGLLLASQIWNLNFYIDNDIKGLFSVQIFTLNKDASILANSFSDIVMLLPIILFHTYYLLKYVLYVSAQRNPRTVVKLTRLNLLKWVTGKEFIFIKVFAWTSFLWIGSIAVIGASLKQQTFLWIGILSFILLILSTWALLRSFEIEIDKIYPKEKTMYY